MYCSLMDHYLVINLTQNDYVKKCKSRTLMKVCHIIVFQENLKKENLSEYMGIFFLTLQLLLIAN